MPPALGETALMLTGLMLASVSMEAPIAVGGAEIEIRPWAAYGILAMLAAGSFMVGLWYPEEIAAAFGQS